jgi:WD40 repeat protein
MKTIRLFLSSTFRDMHAERDHLNRLVFPEVRKRCQRLGADFIAVDLRWGITEEDARRGSALELCLQEIDRCRPFFLGLVGERYGWSPAADVIPRKVYEAIRRDRAIGLREVSLLDDCYRFDATSTSPSYRLRHERILSEEESSLLLSIGRRARLPTASITEWEIRRAVGKTGGVPSHCLFYLREPGIVRHPDFPAAMRPVFVESVRQRRHALAQLKARIESMRKPHIVRRYRAGYEGLRIDAIYLPEQLSPAGRAALSDRVIQAREWPDLDPQLRDALTAHGTAALSGLESFGAMVQEDLLRQIDSALRPTGRKTRTKPLDPHERFILARTRLFVGRKQELARLDDYLRKEAEGHGVFAITGEAGSGKSSLLAEFAARARRRRKRHAVVTLFVGAAPGAADLTLMLRDVFTRLRNLCRLDEPVPDDPGLLRRGLSKWLEAASGKRPVLLVIDALNQLDPGHRSHELDWLPLKLPSKVHLVVSTTAGRCLDVLRQRGPAGNLLEIGSLSAAERREIIERQLALYGKRLSDAHLARLLDTAARPDIRLPLYLLVALHELCLFGDYDGLNLRLERLPQKLEDLFGQVLERLELDHGAALAATACKSMAASRSGLREAELLDLLERERVAVARLDWTRFYRAVEPYMKPMDEAGAGLLDFFHEQLRLAVLRRYFGMTSVAAPPSSEWTHTHGIIAGEFNALAHDEAGRWRSSASRPLSELPFHLMRGNSWNELVDTLGDLRFIEAKCAAGLTYALVTDCEEALREMPTDEPSRVERLNDVARFVNRSSHQLALHAGQPGFVIQHAHHSATEGPVASAADTLLATATAEKDAVFLLGAPGSRPAYQPRPVIVRTFAGRGEDDTKLAMSGDGRLAISTSVDELVVWDVATGEPIRPLRDDDRAHCIALSADSARAVSGSGDQRVRVWDIAAGQCLHRLHGHKDFVVAIAITPDARLGASGSQDGSVVLWDLHNGRLIWRFKAVENSSERLAISPDGRSLVCGGHDGVLRLFDLENRKQTGELRQDDSEITAVAITPDGTRAIAADDDGKVSIWDVASGRRLHLVETGNRSMQGLAVTTDARLIVAGGMNGLELIDAASGAHTKTLSSAGGSVGGVTGLSVTADGRYALSASYDGELNLWDLEAPVQSPRDGDQSDMVVRSVAIAPDLKHAAGAGDDFIGIWPLRSDRGAGIKKISLPDERSCEPVFPMDGSRVVYGSEAGKYHGAIGSANVIAAEASWSAVRHAGYVSSLAITPDGRFAVSSGSDGKIRGWDIDGLRDLGQLSKGKIVKLEVAIGPDGCAAFSTHEHEFGDDQTIYVWDLRNRRVVRKLRGHKSPVNVLAISPSGRVAASGGLDDTIRVWDVAAGRLLREVPGHPNEVRGLVFHADGRSIISSGEDRTVRMWDITTGRCLNVVAENYPIFALALGGIHLAIVLKGGYVRWLELHDARDTVPITTAVRAYLFERHEWENNPKALCPACGTRFAVPPRAAEAIAQAEAALKPGIPPSLQLDEKTFQDERLLCGCPNCTAQTRLNPFAAGGRTLNLER